MTRHLVRHDAAARRPAFAGADTSRAGRGSRAAAGASPNPDFDVLGPLLDAAWMGLWLLDAAARTTYVNRTMAGLLATSPEAAIGRSLFDFLDETAHEEAEALLGGTAGAPSLHAFRFRRVDDSELLALFQATPIGTIDATVHEANAQGSVALVRELRAEDLAGLAYLVLREYASDALFLAGPDGSLRDANARGLELLGCSLDELRGLNLRDVLRARGAGHRPLQLGVLGRGQPVVLERGLRRSDGSLLPVQVGARQLPDGRIIAVVRDQTERLLAREALRASEDRFRTLVMNTRWLVAILDQDLRITFVNDYLLEITGRTRQEVIGADWIDLFVPPDKRAERRAALVAGRLPDREVQSIVTAAGEVRAVGLSGTTIQSLTGSLEIVLSGEDITEWLAARQERDRLVAAVAQLPDAVGIADTSGTLVYANDALAALAGRSAAEVVGRPVAELLPETPPELVAAFEQASRHGETVRGGWRSRRADGSPVLFEGVVSPVRDSRARLTHVTLAARDVTYIREVEEELAIVQRLQAKVSEALLQIRPGASVEENAAVLCDKLVALPGFDFAVINHFIDPETAEILAIHAPAGFPLGTGDRLPAARARYLYERSGQGPWSEYWRARPADGAYGRALASAGLRAIAYGPIVADERPVGLIAIGTTDDAFAATLVERVPGLVAFSAASNAVLAGPLEARRREAELRQALARIIARRAFRPVFQPIVDLVTGETVAYESLTRFDDGQRPDLRFADAWALGLGPDLELATLEAAVAASARLPAGRWVSLNVSPRLLAEPDRLAELLRRAARPVVIELTEHESVADYRAVREAIMGLGPNVQLAVDDAGAGAANLAHIVELRPHFVKLDISLVRGVNSDLARQALVVAMRHFSRAAGCRLIAEGVETQAQASALGEFGVDFGQGFWFGRPATVEQLLARSQR